MSSSGFPAFSFGIREAGLSIVGLCVLTLAAALTLEHVGGFRPCPLCLEERYAHYASIPAALIAVALARSAPIVSRVLLGLIAAAFVFNAGLSAFHAGVEWHWWAGPDSCSGVAPIATTPGDLMKSLASSGGIVRCDEAPLRILGISLAGYGALLSAFLAVLAAVASLGIDPVGKFWGLLRGR